LVAMLRKTPGTKLNCGIDRIVESTTSATPQVLLRVTLFGRMEPEQPFSQGEVATCMKSLIGRRFQW
jgi:hypothetical protein